MGGRLLFGRPGSRKAHLLSTPPPRRRRPAGEAGGTPPGPSGGTFPNAALRVRRLTATVKGTRRGCSVAAHWPGILPPSPQSAARSVAYMREAQVATGRDDAASRQAAGKRLTRGSPPACLPAPRDSPLKPTSKPEKPHARPSPGALFPRTRGLREDQRSGWVTCTGTDHRHSSHRVVPARNRRWAARRNLHSSASWSPAEGGPPRWHLASAQCTTTRQRTAGHRHFSQAVARVRLWLAHVMARHWPMC